MPTPRKCPSCDCECSKKCCLSFLKRFAFDIILLVAVVIGIGMGVGLRSKKPPWTERELVYLKFPGEIFIRMLKMMIIPLMVSSVFTASSRLDAKTSGKVVGKTALYYLSTTFISVIIGVVMVLIIRPGANPGTITRTGQGRTVSGIDAMLDLFRNCFPENIITATFEKVVTQLTAPISSNNTANFTPTVAPIHKWSAKVVTQEGTNTLGLIIFSLVFGIAVGKLGENGKLVHNTVRQCNQAVFLVVKFVLWFTPIGIIFLISEKILEVEKSKISIAQLALYIVTVISGMAIHMLIVLPLIFVIIVRRNPYRYLLGMIEALLTAFSTGISAVTLPATLKCAEEKNNLDERISRFVIPIGATINMDGSALYEAVATIFIAQVNKIPLTFAAILKVSLTAAAVTIGRSGVPEAGLVTMTLVLGAAGLPTNDITLILSVDWLLDRVRTVVSVWGDSIAAAVVQKFSQDDLRKADEEARASQQSVGNSNPNFQGDSNHINDRDVFVPHESVQTPL